MMLPDSHCLVRWLLICTSSHFIPKGDVNSLLTVRADVLTVICARASPVHFNGFAIVRACGSAKRHIARIYSGHAGIELRVPIIAFIQEHPVPAARSES